MLLLEHYFIFQFERSKSKMDDPGPMLQLALNASEASVDPLSIVLKIVLLFVQLKHENII